MSSVYLITGANRGIGRQMTASLLLRPQTTVLALVRDPSNETSKSLSTLPRADGSKVLTTKYDASVPEDAKTAIADLQSKHNITSIDVAVANAGATHWNGPSTQAPADAFVSHFNLNTVSQIMLFQATLPLLKASSRGPPKFISISSQIGSIGYISQSKRGGGMPYGISKCALNYAMVMMANEQPDIIIQILTPGRAATEFGGPDVMRNVPAVVSVEDSVAGLLKMIDAANKETSGKFYQWHGGEVEW